MKRFALPLVALVLTACGQPQVNEPTDPAAPIPTPEQPETTPVPGRTPTLPGRGPTSFVGRWAAQAGWCGNTVGPEQAIEITTTRFEGYENGCDIARIGEVQGGYIAYVTCQAEGETASERLRMSVVDQTLTLTWIDRSDVQTTLKRCPPQDPPPPTRPVS